MKRSLAVPVLAAAAMYVSSAKAGYIAHIDSDNVARSGHNVIRDNNSGYLEFFTQEPADTVAESPQATATFFDDLADLGLSAVAREGPVPEPSTLALLLTTLAALFFLLRPAASRPLSRT